MANKLTVERIANKWLFLADQHYLSARVLFMHSFYPVAQHVSCTAIEMYIKCLLQIRGQPYKKSHDPIDQIKSTDVSLNESLSPFIKTMQEAYSKKYPDSWTESLTWRDYLPELDSTVLELRNKIAQELADKKGVTDLLATLQELANLPTNRHLYYGVYSQQEAFLRHNLTSSRFIKLAQ